MTSLNTPPGSIILALTKFAVLIAIACAGCKHASVSPPPSVAETVDPWKEAVTKVEQDRGEAVGRNATVEVPEQLKHYVDRRRFLAVQTADLLGHVDVIVDFADLVPLIQRHEIVELNQLGADYILYGVGYSASGEPFAHYDPATRQDIPLAATEGGVMEEVQRALNAVKEGTDRLAYLEAERRRAPRRERARRATLLSQVGQARKALASAKAKSKLLAAFSADTKRRKSLVAEYQLLSELARDFEGETYDLNDGDARRRLKVRLLSFIRPEARDLLTQIAQNYKERFDRPLPVSSLLRPVQYQQELARTNANAARGPTPPHSTGLAFDLYYRYMSAAEQEYLMSVVAQLKDDGRVEALREARDNIHVYVFGNGQRPDEKLIARVIASEKSRVPGKKQRAASRREGMSRKRAR
ncbi:MAG TPA: DUF5715 family protein [Blastocatellia bacterium]|nr:DUF5715 family protein [Blastocatellia bacterium]